MPFKWRGFWDFGTGAIGDMGIHNLDTAYWGLELGLPTEVTVKDCSPLLSARRRRRPRRSGASWSCKFPAQNGKPAGEDDVVRRREASAGGALPGQKLIGRDGGSLVIGTKGTLFTRTWHGGRDRRGHVRPAAAQAVRRRPASRRRRVPRTPSHHHEWVDACRGEARRCQLRLRIAPHRSRCCSASSRSAPGRAIRVGLGNHAGDERSGSGGVRATGVQNGFDIV